MQWAKDHSGAETGEVRRRLVFTGGNDTVVVANIDLDAPDPIAKKSDSDLAASANGGQPFFADQTLSLVANEPATLDVSMQSARCDCDFEIVLDLVVNGKQRQQGVRDADGQPSRVAARSAAAASQTGGYYEFGSCDPTSATEAALVWTKKGTSPAGDCLPLR